MRRRIASKILACTGLIFSLMWNYYAIAQDKNTNNFDSPIRKQAEFPGGLDSLVNYLGSHLNYPEDAKKQGIQGQVVATFTVDTIGRIKDIKISKSLSPSCDKEVIRVIETMPNWIPAEADGEKIRIWYTLPVNFRLPEN